MRPSPKRDNDSTPHGISPSDAYAAIRDWYRQNPPPRSEEENYEDNYNRLSRVLISALPSPSKVSEVEMVAVFCEVIRGNLEYAYHADDGHYKMSAYAKAALETMSHDHLLLSDSELWQLRESRLWPYLTATEYTPREFRGGSGHS